MTNEGAYLPTGIEITGARHTDSPIFGGMVLDRSQKLGPFQFYQVQYPDPENPAERKSGHLAVFMLTGDMIASIGGVVTDWKVPVAPMWEHAVNPSTGQTFTGTPEHPMNPVAAEYLTDVLNVCSEIRTHLCGYTEHPADAYRDSLIGKLDAVLKPAEDFNKNK